MITLSRKRNQKNTQLLYSASRERFNKLKRSENLVIIP
ncbi:hypothetical protein JCM19294_47 [Nonlabens tegetincola]|uniref:Uncharacterized protein n=1 Tax=Nonlabens tegetincola TaxID=323273 RepID=A0A090QPX2_9FLAO|nr:hypothetical protein JCM19294_47 [Nonlabens tegetincola]